MLTCNKNIFLWGKSIITVDLFFFEIKSSIDNL